MDNLFRSQAGSELWGLKYCPRPTKSTWHPTWHLDSSVNPARQSCYMSVDVWPSGSSTNRFHCPRSTNINTGFIEPLYTTCSHTQHTATSMCPSLFHSYESHYNIYLLYFPHSYSYLSVGVLCFAGPPLLSKVSLQVYVWSSGPH